ncbi:glutamate 5-kinase [Bifidobacterium actinocoloniiforme DSM 22766]|uniref:Glutamate 5-kinase n=1 Tax=Bifidobacterium actinocoloniiforme DSM 22766 TaxID=1437605 RepID=A0A086Z209_9BIFI|nr:glutamate 5-kinase [Bifidobacterium actinocoloniiforme]AKV55644.1 gamma-glutamyl kinase [Bifidobacterium actinocoloniiforme DSM 22766]KFI40559.1 glutamate 5-kinase [Bifidobacterium actinocoloniiforme DSM 22766]
MTKMDEEAVRRAVAQARTLVVKVGSSSLTSPSGHLRPERLQALVGALARVCLQGARLVLVSSGAIAAGFGSLGFSERPDDLATQQATASVGQGVLMAHYETAFASYGLKVGQILLTAQDTRQATQYRNARRTLGRLLDLGVVAIVNENDALASNEIRFGDNDRLSALVANIVRADALVLLTDVDALYTEPPSRSGARKVAFVPDVVQTMESIDAEGSTSGLGTGGMTTKLEAARIGAVSGIPVLMTKASLAGPALFGDPVGTVFAPVKHRGSARRLWIKFASAPRGSYQADAGAARAVHGGRASLLPAGVTGVEGEFSAGDPVWIRDESGRPLAKGVSAYDAEEAVHLMGRTTSELSRRYGRQYAHPFVHRDDLVLL